VSKCSTPDRSKTIGAVSLHFPFPALSPPEDLEILVFSCPALSPDLSLCLLLFSLFPLATVDALGVIPLGSHPMPRVVSGRIGLCTASHGTALRMPLLHFGFLQILPHQLLVLP